MSLIDPIVPLSSNVPERGSERRRAFKFGAVFATIIGGVGLWKILRTHSVHGGETLVLIAVAILGYCLVHPTGALWLRRGWIRVGSVLGRINSVLLLSVLYVAVVTPLGVFLRVFRRRVSAPDAGGSYFVSRALPRDPKHFEHPY